LKFAKKGEKEMKGKVNWSVVINAILTCITTIIASMTTASCCGVI